MRNDGSARLDEPWTRTLPACVARGLIVTGVFGTIIDAYARQEIVGHEQLASIRAPAIFVANHCSHVDTPVLLRLLPARWRRRTAVVAAADYFYVRRSLAVAVSLAFGTVPLDRRSTGGGSLAGDYIEGLIDRGWNLVVFAEGTRSRDGRVAVLRSGAAVLAVRHGVPIVPVHISGTHAAMPPASNWMVRPEGAGRWARHTIHVTFGRPLAPGPDDEPLEVMESVRLFMVACEADTTPDPRLADHRAAATADDAETALATSGRPV